MPLPEAGIGPIPSVGRGVAPTAVVSAETPGEGPSRPRTDEPAFWGRLAPRSNEVALLDTAGPRHRRDPERRHRPDLGLGGGRNRLPGVRGGRSAADAPRLAARSAASLIGSFLRGAVEE